MPIHTTMVVHGEMFFTLLMNCYSLPNPRELTLDEIVALYDRLRPTLRKMTEPK